VNSNLAEERKQPGLVEGELYYSKDLDLETFIPICIEKYKEKTNAKPTLVVVNELDWKDVDLGIPIYASVTTRPNHVLIGRLRRNKNA